MVYFVRFLSSDEERERERKKEERQRRRWLACFNVLNLKGASGTYQVETRILRAVFLRVLHATLKKSIL